jgi:hypothetical protein
VQVAVEERGDAGDALAARVDQAQVPGLDLDPPQRAVLHGAPQDPVARKVGGPEDAGLADPAQLAGALVLTAAARRREEHGGRDQQPRAAHHFGSGG